MGSGNLPPVKRQIHIVTVAVVVLVFAPYQTLSVGLVLAAMALMQKDLEPAVAQTGNSVVVAAAV